MQRKNQYKKEKWILKEIERDKELAALREEFIKEFQKVFAVKLGKEHRIKCPPVKIELVDDYESRSKKNYSSPRVVYPNLKAAANQQIRELLEAGIIEECKESTVHCSMGQFIPKKTPGKMRLVIDYRSVNDCIKCPQWPMLSSTEIRNSIPDEWKVF